MTLSGELEVRGWYTPLNAKEFDDHDLDIGGSSALVLGGRLVTTGKSGDVWLVGGPALVEGGHWGGAFSREHVFSDESKCAPARYRTAAGQDIVFLTGSGTPGLVAYGTANGLSLVWRAAGDGISLGDAPGSPSVHSFPDQDAVVWIVDDGDPQSPRLRAFRAADGTAVYDSGAHPTDALGSVPHFPPITCATASVFVGTNRGFSCFGP